MFLVFGITNKANISVHAWGGLTFTNYHIFVFSLYLPHLSKFYPFITNYALYENLLSCILLGTFLYVIL